MKSGRIPQFHKLKITVSEMIIRAGPCFCGTLGNNTRYICVVREPGGQHGVKINKNTIHMVTLEQRRNKHVREFAKIYSYFF